MSEFLHKEYPKSFERNDFWSQIKRTVNGQPVSKDQIDMIVTKVSNELELENQDTLLDLGCGNGALGNYFLKDIKYYVGVDFSEYLIGIANEYFQDEEKTLYVVDDMLSYIQKDNNSINYSKVLIYGCISYLKLNQSYNLLKGIRENIQSVEKIFIGNIPDLEFANKFYSNRNIREFDVNDPKSLIGVWWDKNILEEKFFKLGFDTKITKMPTEFYCSKYRMDITLTAR